MKQIAAALIVVVLACSLVSCVEVTTARKGEPAADTQGRGRVTGEKSNVHVYAWNPLGTVLHVLLFPVKAVGHAAKKIF